MGLDSVVSSEELALVEIGCSVFALDLNETDVRSQDVKGGTVIAIETDVDPETGETQRRFVTATPWRGDVRFDVVLASECRQVAPPNASFIRSLVRALAKAVASSKRFGTHQVRCMGAATRLMEVL